MEILEIVISSDGMAKKYVMRTEDAHMIECLYVDYPNKNIICFSTQIGCPIQCNICSAGEFIRNLTVEELVNQCFIVLRDIHNEKDVLFSAMGVGEPVMNQGALIEFFDYVTFIDSKYRLSLSTMVPDLSKFIEMCNSLYTLNLFPKIQISLHSCNPFKRYEIFGGNCSKLENIRLAVLYAKVHFDVELNYALIHGVNDTDEFINELIDFDSSLRILIKLNQFNSPNKCYHPSSPYRIKEVISKLERAGLKAEYYKTNGEDIKGACGQLVGGNYTKVLQPYRDYIFNLKACAKYVFGGR